MELDRRDALAPMLPFKIVLLVRFARMPPTHWFCRQTGWTCTVWHEMRTTRSRGKAKSFARNSKSACTHTHHQPQLLIARIGTHFGTHCAPPRVGQNNVVSDAGIDLVRMLATAPAVRRYVFGGGPAEPHSRAACAWRRRMRSRPTPRVSSRSAWAPAHPRPATRGGARMSDAGASM